MGQTYLQRQDLNSTSASKERTFQRKQTPFLMTPQHHEVPYRPKAWQWGHYCKYHRCRAFATFASAYHKKPIWCSKHAPPNACHLFGKRRRQKKKHRSLAVTKIMKRNEKREVVVNGFIFTTEDEVVKSSTLDKEKACIKAMEDAFDNSIGVKNMLPKGIVS